MEVVGNTISLMYQRSEISDLEFENYKDVKQYIFHKFELAGANGCEVGYKTQI